MSPCAVAERDARLEANSAHDPEPCEERGLALWTARVAPSSTFSAMPSPSADAAGAALRAALGDQPGSARMRIVSAAVGPRIRSSTHRARHAVAPSMRSRRENACAIRSSGSERDDTAAVGGSQDAPGSTSAADTTSASIACWHG